MSVRLRKGRAGARTVSPLAVKATWHRAKCFSCNDINYSLQEEMNLHSASHWETWQGLHVCVCACVVGGAQPTRQLQLTSGVMEGLEEMLVSSWVNET